MHTFVLSTLLAFVPIPENRKVELPTGPQPIFVVVNDIDETQGAVKVRRMVNTVEQVPVQVTAEVNGQNVTTTQFVQQTRTTLLDVVYSLDKTAPQTAGGKKLSKEEAAKRIRAGSVILVSADGRPVDPVFLRVINPETVILTPGVQPPAPRPAPNADVAPMPK